MEARSCSMTNKNQDYFDQKYAENIVKKSGVQIQPQEIKKK